MKLNWGTGIAIFYTMFMIVMITFVIKSKSVDHSLVTDKYYEKDLQYQSHMDKISNAKALKTDLIIKQNEESVSFLFPKDLEVPKGEILFYRPSDNSKDLKIKIDPDLDKNIVINTDEFLPGLWRVKVDWQAGGKAFYKEQIITI